MFETAKQLGLFCTKATSPAWLTAGSDTSPGDKHISIQKGVQTQSLRGGRKFHRHFKLLLTCLETFCEPRSPPHQLRLVSLPSKAKIGTDTQIRWSNTSAIMWQEACIGLLEHHFLKEKPAKHTSQKFTTFVSANFIFFIRKYPQKQKKTKTQKTWGKTCSEAGANFPKHAYFFYQETKAQLPTPLAPGPLTKPASAVTGSRSAARFNSMLALPCWKRPIMVNGVPGILSEMFRK